MVTWPTLVMSECIGWFLVTLGIICFGILFLIVAVILGSLADLIQATKKWIDRQK